MLFSSRRGSRAGTKHVVALSRRSHVQSTRVEPIRSDYVDRSVRGAGRIGPRSDHVVLKGREVAFPWWMRLLQAVGETFVDLHDYGAASSEQMFVVSSLTMCCAIPAEKP